jgi:hypothetical protein
VGVKGGEEASSTGWGGAAGDSAVQAGVPWRLGEQELLLRLLFGDWGTDMSRSHGRALNSLEAMGWVSNSLEAMFASHAGDFLVHRSTIGRPSFYMVT